MILTLWEQRNAGMATANGHSAKLDAIIARNFKYASIGLYGWPVGYDRTLAIDLANLRSRALQKVREIDEQIIRLLGNCVFRFPDGKFLVVRDNEYLAVVSEYIEDEIDEATGVPIDPTTGNPYGY